MGRNALPLPDGIPAHSPGAAIPAPRVLKVNLNGTAVLPEDGSVSGAWATVFMHDVYNGLEPHVKRGEIKQIAVVQELEKSTHSPQNNLTPDGARMRRLVDGRVPAAARYRIRPRRGLGPPHVFQRERSGQKV